MIWSLSIKIKSVTCAFDWNSLGLYSLIGRTSYRKIWLSFEATRFAFIRAVEMPVKFQNDVIIITSNIEISILHEIWRLDALPYREQMPRDVDGS